MENSIFLIFTIIVFVVLYKVTTLSKQKEAKKNDNPDDDLEAPGKSSTSADEPPEESPAEKKTAEMQRISELIPHRDIDDLTSEHEVIRSLYANINYNPHLKQIIDDYNVTIHDLTYVFNTIFPKLMSYSDNGIYLVVEAFFNENSLKYLCQNRYLIEENKDPKFELDIINLARENSLPESSADAHEFIPKPQKPEGRLFEPELDKKTPILNFPGKPKPKPQGEQLRLYAVLLFLLFMVVFISYAGAGGPSNDYYETTYVAEDDFDFDFEEDDKPKSTKPKLKSKNPEESENKSPIVKNSGYSSGNQFLFNFYPDDITKRYNHFALKQDKNAKPLKEESVKKREYDSDPRNYYEYHKYTNEDGIGIIVQRRHYLRRNGLLPYKSHDEPREYMMSVTFVIEKKEKKFNSSDLAYQKAFTKMVSSNYKGNVSKVLGSLDMKSATSEERVKKNKHIVASEVYMPIIYNHPKSYSYRLKITKP